MLPIRKHNAPDTGCRAARAAKHAGPPETAIQKMTTHDKKTNGIHDSMSSAPTAGARPVAGSCPL